MIARVRDEVIKIERSIAQLDLEKENARAALRNKRAQLREICENTLRGHGIDIDNPSSVRWQLNVETMEVRKEDANEVG